jgi:flagellar biosynthesis protein FlhB
MADSSRTERATPRRRNKAREQGRLARSRELPNVLALGGMAAVLTLMGSAAVSRWITYYRSTFDLALTGDLDPSGPLLFWTAVEVMRSIVPVLLAGMTLSVVAGLAQGGLNVAPGALALRFERFNPAARLGQIFSPLGLSSLLKSVLPFGAILCLAINSIRDHWEFMTHASGLGFRVYAGFVANMILSLTWKSGLVLLFWSGVDYALTAMKMNSDLKMTKQEVREEHKDTEGNPLVRSRIRRLQRAMRKKMSIKAAEKATVVVTNPTHYAVALRYEMDMPAPVVVAKGRNLFAEKIKQLARDCGIMVVENKPLAQALYSSVEVGDSIPAKLYQAVAELLALVFRAEAELRKAAAERSSRNASGQKTANPGGKP